MRYCVAVAAVLFAVAAYFLLSGPSRAESPTAAVAPDVTPPPTGASSEVVHQFCTGCHAYPTPDSFPREHWPKEVRRAYDFFRDSGRRGDMPDMESVVEYYLQRAPKEYPAQQKCPSASGPLSVQFERINLAPPDGPAIAKVTNVHLAALFGEARLDVLVCNSSPGRVWAVRMNSDPPTWQALADVLSPCHTEVVDLDGDGAKDVIVADLGSLPPTEHKTGRVIWLKGDRDGHFTPIVLLDGVGRVTDVRARDFNGDGKVDLVVAEFGWQRGSVLYLENQTTDWAKPSFRSIALDDRSGAVAVEVGDINRDGKPDVVAAFGQEHEAVIAFLGDGKGGFTKRTVYGAPHPAYGTSGIQLVDMDGDGDLDVLYTNGDTLDPPFLLKPYHGVQWLENKGTFPFERHAITAQYGAMRAVAADFAGSGRPEVASVSFLPGEAREEARRIGAESIQLLRPTATVFERHTLESGECHHFSCAAGDVFGDSRAHLVVGNYHMMPGEGKRDLITVWRNRGRK